MQTVAIILGSIICWCCFTRTLVHNPDEVIYPTLTITMTKLITMLALVAHATLWVAYFVHLPPSILYFLKIRSDQLPSYAGRYFLILGLCCALILIIFSEPAFYYIVGTLTMFSLLSTLITWQFAQDEDDDSGMPQARWAQFPNKATKKQKKKLIKTFFSFGIGLAATLISKWQLNAILQLKPL